MSGAENFKNDLIIALAVAGSGTIAVLIVLCVLSHWGPRLCGLGRKERWLGATAEEGMGYGGGAPLIVVEKHEQ
jgi:hypothetical protein